MDLTTYKEQLRSEILAIGKSNGVRKTCREAGLNLKIWYNIDHGLVTHAETLERYLKVIKKSLNASKGSRQ